MRIIHLIVTNPTGDLLGRIALSGVRLAAAGENNPAPGSHPVAGVNHLLRQMRVAIRNEGLEPILDDLDLQIHVSRELLRQVDDAAVELRVAVREPSGPQGDSRPKQPALSGGDVLEGVFDVEDLLDLDEGGEDA